MAEAVRDDASPEALRVTRLLQNPLGQEAPPGERGDLVLVSDGRARIYLLANEFDMLDTATLRGLLARQHGANGVGGGSTAPPAS